MSRADFRLTRTTKMPNSGYSLSRSSVIISLCLRSPDTFLSLSLPTGHRMKFHCIKEVIPCFIAKVTTDIGEQAPLRSITSEEWKFLHDSQPGLSAQECWTLSFHECFQSKLASSVKIQMTSLFKEVRRKPPLPSSVWSRSLAARLVCCKFASTFPLLLLKKKRLLFVPNLCEKMKTKPFLWGARQIVPAPPPLLPLPDWN